MLPNKITAILVCLALSACSSEEEIAKVHDEYAALDNAGVRALLDAGNFEKLDKVIRIQEQRRLADKNDFLTHADMFLLQYDGIAAEVALDKAKEAGAEDTELTLRYVRAFMMQRDFRKALDAIGSTVLTGDASYEALLLRGDIHRELNDVDLAREFFTAAIEDRPEHFKGYLGLALLELNLGNLKVAEDLSSKAALYVTDDPIVSYVRGTAARYLLRPDDAIVHLEKAIELHPVHILANLELAGIYIDKNMHEKAQEYLDFVYGISPEDPMARYYSALILATEGKMKEAEEVLLRIGDLTRQFPPAARVYGHVAFRLGKFSNAQPYLERFLGLVPEDRLTRLALAESQTRRGQPAAALATLEPLINGPKGDMEAYMQAAAAAGFMGEMLNALDYIAKAKDLAEHFEGASPELLQSLGKRLALTRFMTGDLEKAAEQLRAMYGDASNDFTSLTLLANLQMDGGDLAGAKKTLAEIAKIAPDQAISHNLSGAINFREGNVEESIVLYGKALAINADYMSALKNRGWAYVYSRQFEKALPDLEKVLAVDPQDAHVHGMIGRTYLELGQLEKSINYLEKAESVFPRSAVILSDHSEVLAEKGFMTSAILKAKKARGYAENSKTLVAYLDDRILTWETSEAARKEAAAEEEALIRKELAEKRALKAEKAAARQALEQAEEAARAADAALEKEKSAVKEQSTLEEKASEQ